jgi:hypothetical protein
MIDPKQALNAKWREYREEFIPDDAGPNQKSALAYAYYRGMKDLMEVLHKATADGPMPPDVEITSFMNGLEEALSDFYDAARPPK